MTMRANIARLRGRNGATSGRQSTVIDKHFRVALPSGLSWHVGMRVYYSLTTSEPPGLVVSLLPIRLVQNRLMSIRVQRIYQGLVAKRRVAVRAKNKTAADVKGIAKVPQGRRLTIDDMRP